MWLLAETFCHALWRLGRVIWSDSWRLQNTCSMLKLKSIESVILSNYLISSATPFFCLQSFPTLGIFSNESSLWIRWPKYWSFSFSNSPSSEYWGLISFRIDWLGLLAVQGTLKSLLQHHDLKASIFSTQPCLWSATSLHDYWKVKSLSRVQLFATPWTVACPSPPSMEFSRQEYWRVPGSSPSWSRVFEGETA